MKVNKQKREYYKKLYLNTRENHIKRAKEYVKKTHYKYEKTPEQRQIRGIKRQTRYYFPLNNHNCEFCGNKAIEHHHNTQPIEFDKFNYICKKCHKEIHKKEVKK